jgi:hypothetical protein
LMHSDQHRMSCIPLVGAARARIMSVNITMLNYYYNCYLTTNK